MTNDVATRRFTDDQLRSITNPQDALKLAASIDGPVSDLSSVLGTGFRVLDDKSKLLGVPFLILDWRFNEGDAGEFVSIMLMTETHKFIINDGSSGIFAQLRNIPVRSYMVNGGLRVSRYKVEITDPKTGEVRQKDAETYYLAV